MGSPSGKSGKVERSGSVMFSQKERGKTGRASGAKRPLISRVCLSVTGTGEDAVWLLHVSIFYAIKMSMHYGHDVILRRCYHTGEEGTGWQRLPPD